jgi:SAM-dependent methyltransferase
MQNIETACKICQNTKENSFIVAKEMMFGTNESFEYLLCENCNCLQIIHPPLNMEAYYPTTYYAFDQSPIIKKSFLSKFLAHRRNSYFLFKNSILGYFLGKIHPNPPLELISKTNIKRDSTVLDIGCGSGHLLYSMRLAGMKNILGADPYLSGEITYENGLKILKKDFSEINSTWDLIMLHHVFEHMASPLEVLKQVYEKLNPGGKCMIRIPTTSSYAWQHYRENWVQLDAPRHFFLHSTESINILAEASGLEIEKILYDSAAFQFWGSEQYKKGIALMSDSSFLMNPEKSIFSKEEMNDFKKQAKKLNNSNEGDQMTIYLRKK